jgi:hypothetical protein
MLSLEGVNLGFALKPFSFSKDLTGLHVMNCFRKSVRLVSSFFVVNIFFIVLMFALSDFDSLDHYPFLPILGGMVVVFVNLGFYKYILYKSIRFLCVALISLSTYHCYVTDSHWRYARILVEHHEKNYTREWYCSLPYKDKLVIESYTFHGIEDCNFERQPSGTS